MKRFIAARFIAAMGVAAAALISAGPAGAQTGNPAGVAAGTPERSPGTPVPRTTNNADQLFAHEIAVGGAAEVDFGRLAEQKGGDPVKTFGRRMVEDHSKLNRELADLAKADNIALPRGLDQEHATMQDTLRKLSGADFDRAYIPGQIVEHQKAAQLLEYEIGSGQDAELKSFASRALLIVMQHLEMAQAIANGTQAMPQAAMAPPPSPDRQP